MSNDEERRLRKEATAKMARTIEALNVEGMRDPGDRVLFGVLAGYFAASGIDRAVMPEDVRVVRESSAAAREFVTTVLRLTDGQEPTTAEASTQIGVEIASDPVTRLVLVRFFADLAQMYGVDAVEEVRARAHSGPSGPSRKEKPS
jgi:hypothetical protein